MTTKITAVSKSLSTYPGLLKRVREAIRAGKERSLAAVQRESVRTKWQVGKLIQEHILLNQSRADYGKRVIKRLSADLGVSDTELYYMVEFARAYPIFRSTGKLPWGHYQALLRINDAEQRKELAGEASRQNWDQDKLRREITKLKTAKQITVTEPPSEDLLVPRKGRLDTYRIITGKTGPWAGQLALDLGFANYHLPSSSLQRFQDRDIVEIAMPAGRQASSSAKRRGGLLAMTVAKGATEQDLFTYRAYLLRVTDADTHWFLIDLGFGFVTRQQLRLRGIDAPEITTREGQEAKRFVERELKRASSIVITSSKSDKYDRYLADVFYTVGGKERFLNNRLLERGLAERA